MTKVDCEYAPKPKDESTLEFSACTKTIDISSLGESRTSSCDMVSVPNIEEKGSYFQPMRVQIGSSSAIFPIRHIEA